MSIEQQKESVKHTAKLPLKVFPDGFCFILDADGKHVAKTFEDTGMPEEYAAFIVRAVNNHDALVKALEELEDIASDIEAIAEKYTDTTWVIKSKLARFNAKEAVAQAKGEV